jgi:hypothetical protein
MWLDLGITVIVGFVLCAFATVAGLSLRALNQGADLVAEAQHQEQLASTRLQSDEVAPDQPPNRDAAELLFGTTEHI